MSSLALFMDQHMVFFTICIRVVDPNVVHQDQDPSFTRRKNPDQDQIINKKNNPDPDLTLESPVPETFESILPELAV